jgi:hypothetical protein
VRAAAQEGDGGTATDTEVSSAPPGSEQPGDKVEVPDVSGLSFCCLLPRYFVLVYWRTPVQAQPLNSSAVRGLSGQDRPLENSPIAGPVA